MRKIVIALMGVLLFSTANISSASGEEGALKTVKDFYVRYFNCNRDKTPDIRAPEMEFSTAFNRELKLSHELCNKYAQGEICGLGADYDPYTGAQDSDDNLDATKVSLQVTREKNGLIKARFNLFPKEGGPFMAVRCKMIQENGKWLVDDIFYDGAEKSARQQIREENEYNLKHGPEDLKLREEQERSK